MSEEARNWSIFLIIVASLSGSVGLQLIFAGLGANDSLARGIGFLSFCIFLIVTLFANYWLSKKSKRNW